MGEVPIHHRLNTPEGVKVQRGKPTHPLTDSLIPLNGEHPAFGENWTGEGLECRTAFQKR